LPGKICKLRFQIFLTGKYKATEKIKDFFGCGKDARASRVKWQGQTRLARRSAGP
jgi:hypothetical protein